MNMITADEAKALVDKTTTKKVKVDKRLKELGKDISNSAKTGQTKLIIPHDEDTAEDLVKELIKLGYQARVVTDPEPKVIEILW